MSSAAVRELPANVQVFQMLSGKWVSRAISVAAELGIADLLSAGDKSTAELARASGSHEGSLYRLLRALASVGVFAETTPRHFTLTPLAACLRSDAPDSIRNQARFYGIPAAWRSWEELLHSVKTGETGFKKAYGLDNAFDYLADHPEEAAVFNAAMTDHTRHSAPTVADSYDFGRFQQIVDIAGGHGLLLATILQRHTAPRGILFDLPQVIDGGKQAMADAGLADRCEVVGGDFFQSVPAGADAYLMKHIIHDWDDQQARTILQNCRDAITPNGRLLLVEMVIEPGNGPSFGKLLDLEMLAIPGGRERTEAEYRHLLRSAGFELISITPTASPVSIIEARPISKG